jgi:hypothetical protein
MTTRQADPGMRADPSPPIAPTGRISRHRLAFCAYAHASLIKEFPAAETRSRHRRVLKRRDA